MTTGRILVVDDEDMNRRLLEAMLVAEGHDVVEAASGAEALEVLAKQPIDLVLLDVMTPGMSGFEVCRRIRNDLGLPDLPVVFVTALGDRESRIRGKDVGAHDFLTKPVDDVELVVRVRSLLRLKAQHEALRREVDQFKLEMTSLVVHDLKNVMFIISANVDTALEVGDRGDAEQQAMLSDAKDAAARAIRLIANLMDVARLEASAMPLDVAAVAPEVLCESASRHRVSQLRSRGIALAVDARGLPPVAADFEIVLRVIDNVLDNAVRYTPSGGIIGIAATETADGRVQIQIGNTGRAIPIDDRRRIFEKYGQAAPAGEANMNSGLGLYFCRLAIEAHGGRMWVEQRPDFPTTFVIELPVAAAATYVPRMITTRLPQPSREKYPRDSWPPPGSLPL